MFLLREGPQVLVPWLNELTARFYRTHAVVMADHTDRGRIIRMDTHSGNFSPAENRAIWARILLRSDSTDGQ